MSNPRERQSHSQQISLREQLNRPAPLWPLGLSAYSFFALVMTMVVVVPFLYSWSFGQLTREQAVWGLQGLQTLRNSPIPGWLPGMAPTPLQAVTPSTHLPPLHAWGVALTFNLSLGPPFWRLSLISYLCGITSLYLLYKLGKSWLSRAAGLLACFLLLFNESFLQLIRAGSGALVEFTCQLLLLWTFSEHVRQEADVRSRWTIGVGFAWFGLLLSTGLPALASAAYLFALVLLARWERTDTWAENWQELRADSSLRAWGLTLLIGFLAVTPIVLTGPVSWWSQNAPWQEIDTVLAAPSTSTTKMNSAIQIPASTNPENTPAFNTTQAPQVPAPATTNSTPTATAETVPPQVGQVAKPTRAATWSAISLSAATLLILAGFGFIQIVSRWSLNQTPDGSRWLCLWLTLNLVIFATWLATPAVLLAIYAGLALLSGQVLVQVSRREIRDRTVCWLLAAALVHFIIQQTPALRLLPFWLWHGEALTAEKLLWLHLGVDIIFVVIVAIFWSYRRTATHDRYRRYLFGTLIIVLLAVTTIPTLLHFGGPMREQDPYHTVQQSLRKHRDSTLVVLYGTTTPDLRLTYLLQRNLRRAKFFQVVDPAQMEQTLQQADKDPLVITLSGAEWVPRSIPVTTRQGTIVLNLEFANELVNIYGQASGKELTMQR